MPWPLRQLLHLLKMPAQEGHNLFLMARLTFIAQEECSAPGFKAAKDRSVFEDTSADIYCPRGTSCFMFQDSQGQMYVYFVQNAADRIIRSGFIHVCKAQNIPMPHHENAGCLQDEQGSGVNDEQTLRN
ncbi:uncharacterized protein [Palaemon carinicauda]|uniref:uncharacterized protein isoform X2 n=1 Tax=Palaemon carinicauda TaxID=392227 RepID=UPI0035B622DF